MTPAPQRKGRGWLPPVIVGGALLLGVAAGGGTFALWSDAGQGDSTTITTGDIDVVLRTLAGEVQTAEWTQDGTTPITTPQAISAATFLARPGDVVVLSFPVTTKLTGDNLAAELTVSATGSVTAPVTATYRVYDGGTAVTPETSLGLPASGLVVEAGETSYEVRVTVTFPDTIEDEFGDGTATEVAAALGDLTATLEQVRNP